MYIVFSVFAYVIFLHPNMFFAELPFILTHSFSSKISFIFEMPLLYRIRSPAGSTFKSSPGPSSTPKALLLLPTPLRMLVCRNELCNSINCQAVKQNKTIVSRHPRGSRNGKDSGEVPAGFSIPSQGARLAIAQLAAQLHSLLAFSYAALQPSQGAHLVSTSFPSASQPLPSRFRLSSVSSVSSMRVADSFLSSYQLVFKYCVLGFRSGFQSCVQLGGKVVHPARHPFKSRTARSGLSILENKIAFRVSA